MGNLGAMSPRVLWSPPSDASQTTAMGRFASQCSTRTGLDLSDYRSLWQWSVDNIDGFWTSVLDYFKVDYDGDPAVVRVGDEISSTRWFPGLSLNYAGHALRSIGLGGTPTDDGSGGYDDSDDPDRSLDEGTLPAIIAESQLWGARSLDRNELRKAVAEFQRGLIKLGLKRGDAVGAYLPNLAETIIAFLACAGLGVTWASCAPEFGPRAVVDRLVQLQPKLLLAVEGYRYGDKLVDRRADLAEIISQLPSLQATVVLPPPGAEVSTADALSWGGFIAAGPGGPPAHGPIFDQVPFEHPLYVLFSSGTTGTPKPIVHGHGGILIEHLKTLGLQSDLGPGDRFFWFSTTGWMMWNLLVSALTVGSAVVCFDGDPIRPDPSALWDLAARTGTTYFGTSASYLMAERSRGAQPAVEHDLSRVKAIGSTGSPLPPAGFSWVADNFGPSVQLASISGGTDVCSALVGSAPLVEVWEGEISCRYLGAAIDSYDTDGKPLVDVQGELVITEPMPSMPIGFLGDEDRSRLKASYFERFPGVWAHGDWVTITDRGSCIISGRSDATLNRGGVRLGTSEFYAVVESTDAIADSLVIHLEDADGGPGRLLLFVVMAEGASLTDELVGELRALVRNDLSPRHVPDEIRPIRVVPRTLSGKKVEVPVKAVLRGADPADVVSLDSLTDPTSLDQFVGLAQA